MAEAYERKLRPVYDALDGRNWKAAIKSSTAALQKYKNDQLLRALRSWALLKAGREEEAVSECEGLIKDGAADETALQITGMVMRSVGRGREMTAAYAVASAARPNDIGLLRALFGAYLRESDFAKQQQVALKLERLDVRHEERYIWWAIVSLVLQADAASQKPGGSVMSSAQLFRLAQSMAEKKFAARGSEEGYEALMVYLHILKEQGKYKEALAAVTGDLGKAIQMEKERVELQAGLLERMGRLEEASDLAKTAWLKDPGDWKALQLYLDWMLPSTRDANSSTAFQQQDADQVDKLSEAEMTVHEVVSVEEGKAGSSGSMPRGAALAAVELELRRQMLSSAGGPASTSGSQGMADAILRCYTQTGHTMSCAADLRFYIGKLHRASREWLVQQLKCYSQTLREGKDAAGHSWADLRKLVAAYQIESDLGLPFPDAEAAVAHAQQMVDLYAAFQQLCSGLDEKERGPADELLVIAANALVAAWKLDQAQAPTLLLQAVLLLAAAQVRRKVSAGLRLAAAALYSILGAPLLVQEQLQALDIKHIQHYTLSGHLLLPALLSGMCDKEADHLLHQMAELYDGHLQECGESLMLTYTSQNYTQALDFVNFKERLERSVGRASSFAESCILSMGNAARSSLEKSVEQAKHMMKVCDGHPSLWQSDASERLYCNEDFASRPAWLPPSAEGPMLALADWWQAAAEGKTILGRADCWWSNVSAAESPDPKAQNHKRRSISQLRKRALQPALLYSMLLLEQEERDSQQWTELFNRLLEAHSIAETSLEGWIAALPGQIQKQPLTEISSGLNLALFSAVQARQGSDRDCLESRCRALGKSVLAASVRVSHEMRSNQNSGRQLLTFGPGWVVATSLVQELTWVALWLRAVQAGQAGRQKGRKALAAKQQVGKAGSQKGAPSAQGLAKSNGHSSTPAHERCQLAEAQTAELRNSIHEAAKTLKATCEAGLAMEVAANALNDQLTHNSGLWVWEADFSAQTVLQSIISDQHALLTRLQIAASQLMSICKHGG